MKLFRIVFFWFFLISFLSSCSGYQPLRTYAQKDIGKRVFVDLFVELRDPKNSIVIKDEVDKIIVQKLNRNLVYDKKLADTILKLRLNSVNITALQYDKSGYVQLYKAIVTIFVSYNKSNSKEIKSFTVSGENNFSTDTSDNDDTITDRKRFSAISKASEDALDELLSKISINSYN